MRFWQILKQALSSSRPVAAGRPAFVPQLEELETRWCPGSAAGAAANIAGAFMIGVVAANSSTASDSIESGQSDRQAVASHGAIDRLFGEVRVEDSPLDELTRDRALNIVLKSGDGKDLADLAFVEDAAEIPCLTAPVNLHRTLMIESPVPVRSKP